MSRYMGMPPSDKAPFLGGVLLHYPTDWEQRQETFEWRDITARYDLTLRLEGLQRGRSAAYFLWSDELACTWPMFMKDMVELVRSEHPMVCGIVAATWRVRKRGQNYGIALEESS